MHTLGMHTLGICNLGMYTLMWVYFTLGTYKYARMCLGAQAPWSICYFTYIYIYTCTILKPVAE